MDRLGPLTVVAVDLGASSGRVMLGVVEPPGRGAGHHHADAETGSGRVELVEVHRFDNEPVEVRAGSGAQLHWDVAGIHSEVLTGLRAAGEEAARLGLPPPSAVGIDSWAVDYGLLDSRGDLLGMPYCYRDARNAVGVAAVHAVVPPQELYGRNGLQFMPFNTLYQLATERDRLAAGQATLLLIPDLLGHWLTGARRAEVTNASTTGLLDATTRTWDLALAERLGLDATLLPPLVQPGEEIGTLLPDVARDVGLPPDTPVIAVGSHDTASAVVGVPATSGSFAYISSGTWSLVGVELDRPVLTEQSRAANFTNEGGVDGTVRYLRNVMGLWLLSESLRTWERDGDPVDLEQILGAAAGVGDGGPVIDPDAPAFLPPGDMPARIAEACRATGQPVPADRASVVRCILDSLAQAYARAVADARRLSGRQIEVIHVVGGGSRNTLLCRLTAAATGLPVLAGPVEATALGNVLVQARALGAVPGDLTALRHLVPHNEIRRFDPVPGAGS